MERTSESPEHLLSEVRSAFEKLAEAARALNHDRYFSFFDQNTYNSLNPDGSVLHQFADFREMYLEQVAGIEKYLQLEFTNVHLDLVGSNVIVLVNEYSAELQLQTGQTICAKGAGTQVWSKASGKWLLVNVSGSIKPA